MTGFFYPVIREDPNFAGSLGAGFSLAEYVRTQIRRREDTKVKIYFNGEDVSSEAETSRQAAKEFFKISGIKQGVDIFHQFKIPISCGLATSGAGALGVVYGLNENFDTSFPPVKLATLAHIAEVKQKTGLGSVIAQYKGKFEVRVKAGSPKIGKVRRFRSNAEFALLMFGRIETKDILSSKQRLRVIKRSFGKKHKKLAKQFSIEHFMNLSQQFAIESGLLPSFLQKPLEKAHDIGLLGSMLMLGRGVFLFGKDLKEKLQKLLPRLPKTPNFSLISQVDNRGVTKK